MRPELVDAICHVAGLTEGRLDADRHLYLTIVQSLGYDAAGKSLKEARVCIAAWIEEYNRDRTHRGVQNRTPHEAFLSFAVDLKNEALTV